jgi:hypothetical protein
MRRGFLKPKTGHTLRLLAQPVSPKVIIPSIAVHTGEDFSAPTYVDDPELFSKPITTTRISCVSVYHGPQKTTVVWFYGMKEKVLPMLPRSYPFPFNMPLTPCYRIESSGKYGLGMFATVDIKIGDIIACETALFMVPQGMPHSPEIKSDPLEQYVNFMEARERELLLGLSNCNDTNWKISGIIGTNSLAIGKLPGYPGQYAGVFRDISRINHRWVNSEIGFVVLLLMWLYFRSDSCSPNALQRWDLSTFTCGIRALRPIRAGEQIFITYIDPSKPRQTRQDQLMRQYSFKCACPSCSLPASARSDWNRYLLYQDRDPTDERDLRKWAVDLSLPDDHIIKPSLSAVEMMDEEGLYAGIWDYHYQRLCKAYCALSNESEAKRWAEKAAALTVAHTGSDGGWAKVITSLRNTNWWGLRTKAIGES